MTNTKRRLTLFAALIIALGILASGCSLIQKTPEAIAKQKVAKVGNEYITRGELDELVNYQKGMFIAQYGLEDNYFESTDGKEMLSNIKKQLLDSMIDQKLLEQKATELKLFKDENEIDTEAKKVIDTEIKQGKSDEDYKKWLNEAKINETLLKKLVRQQVIAEKVYNNLVKDVTVTDNEIKEYYNKNQSSFTEKPNTMEVSHILLKTEDEAKKIKARLDKGEDFATLAKQYSIETSAKETGGNLGEISYNDSNYDQTFMLAAMSLKEGQISNPVQTKYGYHIIKVTKKTEYPVLAFDKVKEDIKSQLLESKKQDKYTASIQEWRKEAKVKTYDKNIENVA